MGLFFVFLFFFFGGVGGEEKKTKLNILAKFAKMFETVVGVELLEGDKRTVFGSMENISLNVESPVSDSGLPYNKC